MTIRIERWNRAEPTLKMKFYRFLQPYAGLLDSLISICTFSQFISNFQLTVTEKHMKSYFSYLKSKSSH